MRLSRKVCWVPGCNRCYYDWKRRSHQDGNKILGRQPFVYTIKYSEDNVVSYDGKLLSDVCDIHFSVHDFCPWYTGNKYLTTNDRQPIPPHLQYARIKFSSVPSLFMDEQENLAAKTKAKLFGDPDWWKYADSYDERLELDTLQELFKPAVLPKQIVLEHDVQPLPMIAVLIEGEDVAGRVDCAENPSYRLCDNKLNVCQQLDTLREIYNPAVIPNQTVVSHDVQPVPMISVFGGGDMVSGVVCAEDQIVDDIVTFKQEDSDADDTLESGEAWDNGFEVDHTQRYHEEEEAKRKKLQLFRMLCTSPLTLPNHWAVHSYIDDNYLIISKDTFSEEKGFVVERAVRVTSTMDYPNIHCKGRNISKLLQGQPLNSISDLEKLIEKVDMW